MNVLAVFLGLVGGLAFGFILAFLIQKSKQSKIENLQSSTQKELDILKQQLEDIKQQHHKINEENQSLKQEKAVLLSEKSHFEGVESQLEKERILNLKLNQEKTELLKDNEHIQKKMAEKEAEFKDLEQKFLDSFKNLSNQILDEKSKKFTDLNQTQIESILKPLQEKIKEFQEKVEKSHTEGLEKNAALSTKIEEIQKMATTLSLDAQNLTKALKGDNKAQGNWGEILLERILETSGMIKGKHYHSQAHLKSQEGEKLIPDVIIDLPNDKHLIIDSKVSLIAYQNWVNATNEEEQEAALKDLTKSLTNHINDLSSKSYQNLKNINSPDFVFLFLPVEPVLGLALKKDPKILNYAWERKIMISTPTTLTATLWTIQNVWQQENQIENIKDIFDVVSKIYDKIILFLESLEKVGKHIDNAKASFDEANNRLKSGKGNAISQMEKLKSMGMSSIKKLPETFENYEDLNENEE